ncbi:MAG TPA: phosphopantetheine-binding protein [Humisphaera sp.]|jgi:3-hydroxyacyl-[acyl-carrier-protein] dehydratase|nr:phosphopantetheine-binding protein [Humisphaera sp.]
MPTPRPETLELVKTLLRRDLKLAPNAPIADEMPFFGGDMDLDSLDILLLMTSIEKQFKIKVPSETIGKQVFQNVTTLATYIEQHAPGGPDIAAAPASEPQPADYLARLPHGPEFRFVSRITKIGSGAGEAVWALKGDEPFFAGHFPGNPVVPGVLIAEALAQLSGLVGPDTGARGGKLAQVDIRFETPVIPPAEITLHSRLLRVMDSLQQFEVRASLGEKTVASGTITLHRGAAN